MLGFALLLTLGFASPADDYTESILQSRKDLEAGLRAPGGWLAVSGLVWLKDGDRVKYDVDTKGHPVVPASSAGAGTIVRKGEFVFVETGSGNELMRRELKPNSNDKIEIGSGTMFIIQRGDRIGVRVYDAKSEALTKFQGQKWYPVDPKMKIKAKYVPYKEARQIDILDILGEVSKASNPGYVMFMVDGKSCRLEVEDQGHAFFLNFRDKTSGKETYGAGRFLYAQKPTADAVVLDFNLAINPPCAFTDFATCPLPPKGNGLAVEIRAGELAHQSS